MLLRSPVVRLGRLRSEGTRQHLVREEALVEWKQSEWTRQLLKWTLEAEGMSHTSFSHSFCGCSVAVSDTLYP